MRPRGPDRRPLMLVTMFAIVFLAALLIYLLFLAPR